MIYIHHPPIAYHECYRMNMVAHAMDTSTG